MNISDKLTQGKLMKILEESYREGQQKENIQIKDFVEEIKHQVLSVINAK